MRRAGRSSGRRQPSRLSGTAALALALCLLPGLALAQGAAGARPDRYVPPARADQTTLALGWIAGRFEMPVTCKLRDGRSVELYESVSIRPAPQRGNDTYKAVFFGIDVADAERCYNLIEPELEDRRGVVYFTYRAIRRTDFGLRDFRNTLEEGELEYHVSGGQLTVRPVGAGDSQAEGPGEPGLPEKLAFDGGASTFTVRLLPPRSDGARLLAQRAGPEAAGRRQLEFRIQPDAGPSLHGYYLEAPR